VIPIAAMAMLYGIPYFATQSFLVRYCEVRNLPVNYSAYFVIYACVLLVPRLTLKNLFDRLPYKVFALTACAMEAIGMVCMTFLYHNWIMVGAAICFAASYGIMCSVCQSTAILIAGPGGRGLANSTYYMGMDMAMSLGPVLGGILYGNLDIALFYPVLGLTIPVCAVLAVKYH
jgi:MFS family permease